MSINQVFHDFINSIRPSRSEMQNAHERRNYLVQQVQNFDIGVFDVRNSGSYAKRTAITPMNDIDVVFYINIDEYPYETELEILETIKREIRPLYSQNTVFLGNHSIKIEFSSGPNIDIVPAISNGEQINGAQIIDRETGNWISTSIPKHIQFANNIQNSDARYKDLVKLFKIWKNNRRRAFPSFLLSLIVAFAVREGLSRGWKTAVFEIFSIIRNHSLNTPISFNDFYQEFYYNQNDPVVVMDPSNNENNVASFMDWNTKQDFLNAWENSYFLARNAVNSTNRQNKLHYWREIFGNRFPSNYRRE